MTEDQNSSETIQTTTPPPLPPKKSKKKLIWSLIIGFIVIVFLAMFLLNKSAEFKPADEDRKIEALFSASAYDKIPEDYKGFIYQFLLQNNYLDGSYFMTKIPDRANKVFAFGDFTGDGQKNMAVILEKADFKSSQLVIFNQRGELLFIEDYENDLPVINSFKEGAKIFLEENKLISAPVSGLIVQKESSKYVVIYDTKAKKFSSYYQYTNDDLNASEEEYPDGGDYDEPVVEPEISTPTAAQPVPTTESTENSPEVSEVQPEK